MALANCYGMLQTNGIIDPYYLIFAIIGLIGSVLGTFGKIYSRWFLYIFYGLQLFFIYGETFRFVMSPGLAFPIKMLSGTPQEAFANPTGFGINLLAIIMLILCFLLLRSSKIAEKNNV